MSVFVRRAIASSPTVVVSLLSGRSIKGALVERGDRVIVLRAAMVSDEDAAKHVTWERMDGDVVIPWDQVEFWQEGLDAALLASPLG